MNREPFSTQATAVIINGKVQGDWDYPHANNDEDLNGNNGLEYVWDEAQELGFKSNMEYFLSLRPHKEPKTIEELEENWSFICEKVYDNDGYYHFYEEYCSEVEVKETNTIVVVATAYGELGA